mgnify:FL=1|tara:strand:- start:1750 stop:2337 length:588 start_codon:yes stop_codon:yes gene_type:complete
MSKHEESKKKLILEWEKNLKNKGVKLPGHNHLNALVCLYNNFKKPVSQDKIANWITKYNLGRYDRQLRHIASKGWYIKTGNKRATLFEIDEKIKFDEYVLFSIKEPNPIWNKNNVKRKEFLTSQDWTEILKTFKERGCAVCGIHYKNYDKGHLDTSKPLEIGNIVPMCTSCNNWGQRYDLCFKLAENLVARPIIK